VRFAVTVAKKATRRVAFGSSLTCGFRSSIFCGIVVRRADAICSTTSMRLTIEATKRTTDTFRAPCVSKRGCASSTEAKSGNDC